MSDRILPTTDGGGRSRGHTPSRGTPEEPTARWLNQRGADTGDGMGGSRGGGPTSLRPSRAAMATLAHDWAAQIPALQDIDPRLLNLILPHEDAGALVEFVPAQTRGLSSRVEARLQLPAAARTWQAVLRTNVVGEGHMSGFVSWQSEHVAGSGCPPDQALHITGLTRDPKTGEPKLALLRGSLGAFETTPLTTTRVHDYESDRDFMALKSESFGLRHVLTGAYPDEVQVIRTSMDRPVQSDRGGTSGARSHHYYVYNPTRPEGEDLIHVHFFKLWQYKNPVAKATSKLWSWLAPSVSGHFEAQRFCPAGAPQSHGSSLDGVLPNEAPDEMAAAQAAIDGPRKRDEDTELVTNIAVGASQGGWLTGVRRDDVLVALKALRTLDRPQWLAVLDDLSAMRPNRRALPATLDGRSALARLAKAIARDTGLGDMTRGQVRAKLGLRDPVAVSAATFALGLSPESYQG